MEIKKEIEMEKEKEKKSAFSLHEEIVFNHIQKWNLLLKGQSSISSDDVAKTICEIRKSDVIKETPKGWINESEFVGLFESLQSNKSRHVDLSESFISNCSLIKAGMFIARNEHLESLKLKGKFYFSGLAQFATGLLDNDTITKLSINIVDSFEGKQKNENLAVVSNNIETVLRICQFLVQLNVLIKKTKNDPSEQLIFKELINLKDSIRYTNGIFCMQHLFLETQEFNVALKSVFDFIKLKYKKNQIESTDSTFGKSLAINPMRTVRIDVVGWGATGKNCLVRLLCGGEFFETLHSSDGEEFIQYVEKNENTTIRFNIYIHAGQDVYTNQNRLFASPGGIVIVVVAEKNAMSRGSLDYWIDWGMQNCKGSKIILVKANFDPNNSDTILFNTDFDFVESERHIINILDKNQSNDKLQKLRNHIMRLTEKCETYNCHVSNLHCEIYQYLQKISNDYPIVKITDIAKIVRDKISNSQLKEILKEFLWKFKNSGFIVSFGSFPSNHPLYSEYKDLDYYISVNISALNFLTTKACTAVVLKRDEISKYSVYGVSKKDSPIWKKFYERYPLMNTNGYDMFDILEKAKLLVSSFASKNQMISVNEKNENQLESLDVTSLNDSKDSKVFCYGHFFSSSKVPLPTLTWTDTIKISNYTRIIVNKLSGEKRESKVSLSYIPEEIFWFLSVADEFKEMLITQKSFFYCLCFDFASFFPNETNQTDQIVYVTKDSNEIQILTTSNDKNITSKIYSILLGPITRICNELNLEAIFFKKCYHCGSGCFNIKVLKKLKSELVTFALCNGCGLKCFLSNLFESNNSKNI